MQHEKEFEQNIERMRSRLVLAGLSRGALSGALVLTAMYQFWLKLSPSPSYVNVFIELMIGGFLGAVLGFFIGLVRGVYLYPEINSRRRRRKFR